MWWTEETDGLMQDDEAIPKCNVCDCPVWYKETWKPGKADEPKLVVTLDSKMLCAVVSDVAFKSRETSSGWNTRATGLLFFWPTIAPADVPFVSLKFLMTKLVTTENEACALIVAAEFCSQLRKEREDSLKEIDKLRTEIESLQSEIRLVCLVAY